MLTFSRTQVHNSVQVAYGDLPFGNTQALCRRDSDPSVIVLSEIKRCQHPHFTQNFQKAKEGRRGVILLIPDAISHKLATYWRIYENI